MRRHVEPEVHNHERWVISYADFITLLFAFFVVMYSISSVNEGKYKVLSKSLEQVFSESKTSYSKFSLGIDNPSGKNFSDREIQMPRPGDYADQEEYKYSIDGADENVKGGGNYEEDGGLDHITESLTEQFSELIKNDLVAINSNDLWAEIEIKSSVLFPSGKAAPSKTAVTIVKQIASELKKSPNPIHVEGFTDNIPISNEVFPSNWELSAARAAAVVRLLSEGGVAAERLAAVGYGEHQPVADNGTAEGRQKNRRVVMVISRDISNTRTQQSQQRTNTNADQPNAATGTTSGGSAEEGDFFEFGNSSAQSAAGQTANSKPERVLSPIEQAIQKGKEEQARLEKKKRMQQSLLRPVQLDGGGLLFTSDPKEGDDRPNEESNRSSSGASAGGNP